MSGAIPTPSGLKANSCLDKFRRAQQSATQQYTGQQLASTVERLRVEKLWEKDLINLANFANKLHEVGIQLCVHRLVSLQLLREL